MGAQLPANGEELLDEKLSLALMSKAKFTEDEWKSFGIGKLQMNHCIKSGNAYFQPAEPDGQLELEPHHTHFLIGSGDPESVRVFRMEVR